MGKLTKTTKMNAPLDRIWAIWLDVENTPSWVCGVEQSRITGGDASKGVGFKWQEDCHFANNAVQMDHEITGLVPNERVVVHTGLPMGGVMDRSLVFEKSENAIQVTLDVEWDLGIAGMILGDEKVQSIMEETCEETLKQWKRKAESS